MCLQLLVLQLYMNLSCCMTEAFASQIFVATWRKPLTSLYLTNQLSNVNNLFNVGKRRHSASSIVATMKSWKSDMVFYEHISIKKRLCLKQAEQKITLFQSCFIYNRWKKSKGKTQKGPVPSQDEWTKIPH